MWTRKILRKCLNSSVFNTYIRLTSTSSLTPEFLMKLREGENTYAISHLMSLPEYKNTLFDSSHLISQDKWNTFKPVVQQMKMEAINPENPLTSITTPSFISSIIAEKTSFSDEELWAVMYAIQLYKSRPFPKSETAYKDLWLALDEECVTRCRGWDINTLFTVDDLFFRMNSIGLSNFHWHVIKRLFRKCDKLSKEQFVRFMFCINVGRKLPKVLNTYELEHNLLRVAEGLTPEEIGIIAMGFFKSETRIRDDNLMKQLLQKVIPSASYLNCYFVSSISKLARFCGKSGIANTLYEFQDKFVQELHRLDLTEAIHIALVGTNTQVKHTGFLEGIRDKTESNLNQARLKEIERVLLALTMFNIDCDSLCLKVIEQLRQPSTSMQKECEAYGRCLPSILHYTTMRNIFPQDLISKVLDPVFLKTYYDKNRYKYQREMLCLDLTTAIECPDYSGHRFSDKDRQSVTKYNMLFINTMSKEKLSDYQSGLRSVSNYVKDILGGEEFVYLCNILPQFHTAEILYCMDEDNQPVPVPESIRQLDETDVKWIPKNDPTITNITFHLILYCHRNICIFGQKLLLGQAIMHCRQLEKMGYNIHYVFGIEWQAYQSDDLKRKDHIHNLVYGSTNSNGFQNILTANV